MEKLADQRRWCSLLFQALSRLGWVWKSPWQWHDFARFQSDTVAECALSFRQSFSTLNRHLYGILFAKGRDLWGSRLFGVRLAVQALLAGAADFFFLAFLFPQNQETQSGYRFFLQVGTIALVGHMLIIAYETLSKHESTAVARAIHEMTKGKYAKINRWGVQILGQVLPVAIFAILAITKIGARIEGLGIFMLSLIGLFCFCWGCTFTNTFL